MIPASHAERTRTVPTFPRFIRGPFLVAWWVTSFAALIAATSVGRSGIPNVVRGIAVVAARSDSPRSELLLLLPAASRRYARAGQTVTLDAGESGLIAFTISAVDSAIIGDREARVRFPHNPTIIAQIQAPTVIAHLSPCTVAACRDAAPGVSYRVHANLGARTLVSYLMPGS